MLQQMQTAIFHNKKVLASLLFFTFSLSIVGQSLKNDNDPILMTINGKNVTKSEFEYSFHKNSNVEGAVEEKTLDEYLPMFINYKLKVAAAEEAKLDTLTSFKKEFLTYRDMQLTPYMVDSFFIDSISHVVYENTVKQLNGKDLIETAHILLRVGSKDSEEIKEAQKNKADSIYNILEQGGDFAELARLYSQDKGTASKGGILPVAGPGSFVKEFEEAAYSLQNNGEISKPILSPFGYHIIKMINRKSLEPYDTLRPQILKMLKRQNIEEASSEYRIKKIVDVSGGKLTRESVLDSVMQANIIDNEELRYLIQEYHDGLLLYEVSKRQVWDVAQADTIGLENWYKTHKENYKWEKPHFSGYVFHVKEKKLLKQVKKLLKSTAKYNNDWRKAVRQTFNKDSVRVSISGPYRGTTEGENAFIDAYAFKNGKKVETPRGFVASDVYGKILKQPKSWLDVAPQVSTDYQNEKEKEWVAALRQHFKYSVNEDVLQTVK